MNTKDNRGQQVQEIMDKTQELLNMIIHSDVYIRYQKELEELKASDDIYERMNEYRKKNLALQLWEGSEDSYEKMQELYAEYKDILSDPLVSRFMMTEQSICKIMRKVQNQVFDGLQLDISYME